MIIFDIETNGLNPDKIHCLSYTRNGECFETLYKYDEMRKLVLSGEPLLGHNIIRYDIRCCSVNNCLISRVLALGNLRACCVP